MSFWKFGIVMVSIDRRSRKIRLSDKFRGFGINSEVVQVLLRLNRVR